MISKSDYLELKRAVPFNRTPWPTLMVLLVDIGLVVLSLGYLARQPFPAYALSQLLLALVGFHAFAIVHECGHGNVFRSWLGNAILGHLVSPFALLPYFPWQHIHAEHHLWTGNMEKDPTLVALKRFRKSGRVTLPQRLAWHLWIPVGGLIQHLVFWTYPISLLSGRQASGKLVAKSIFSVGFLIAACIWTASCWPTIVTLGNLLPAMVLYFVLIEVVNLPHHSDRQLR